MSLITAIICTHNRASYLAAAIDSLLHQDMDDYDVIVVDNGSTDNTADVVKERLDNPRLTYIYEPKLGLSVARNTGAMNTDAQILAYLDDDAEASVSWLKNLVQVYQNDSQVAIAGGSVNLILPEGYDQLPEWISEDLAGALGLYNLGEEIKYITEAGLTPRGLNYSIRRQFLMDIGGFDINLGRVGTKLLSNEELYMTELALKKGYKVAYIPDAKVGHNVQPERLKKDWFLRRSWWQGISEYYRAQGKKTNKSQQFLNTAERILRGIYKSFKYYGNPAVRFENLLYVYGQFGYLKHLISGGELETRE
ncbi:glycosyl transferase family 2 [Cyanobacterium stanieri PCC 7202]|uniref:Glycosyl transferase family 2 n=1 Tax=Cyanobacterium stanieri (strain ATCC 29140 / PCC 7202) TaxID=292563 RepID=K9YMC3_CYASC|nr:glycosyl transferase family 2 [Cyanobacterium stanieri PCC 7202]